MWICAGEGKGRCRVVEGFSHIKEELDNQKRKGLETVSEFR